MDERRGRDRCPVCQGPTKQADDGTLRCRKSICAYNHRHEACPRCKHKGPEVSSTGAEGTTYSCPECMNKWTKAAS